MTADFSRLSAFLQQDVAGRRIPGAAMLIERRGQTILRQAWGARDPAAPAAMTVDSIFRINSMTKPMVSLLAMMLIEEGRLRLDQPVAELIPAFATLAIGTPKDGAWDLREPAFPMTVQDLLRHTAGITYGTAGGTPLARLYAERGLLAGDFDTAEFVARLARLPLACDPGTQWDYSHSTDVLGHAVELVTGQSLGVVLQERLTGPLGMQDTGFHVAGPAQHGRIAEAFPGDSPFGPGTRLPDPRLRRRFESGGGGLVSTLDDYAQFCRMILAGGRLDGRRYISRAALALMTADHIGPGTGITKPPRSMLGPAYGFGLGFAVRTAIGGAAFAGSVGELTWSGIAGAYFWIDPAEAMFVIFLSQAPAARFRLRSALRGLVYGALS